VELSEQTWQIIRILFSASQHDEVARLLGQECGNNLPFLANLDKLALERFRFAALKLSEGRMDKLQTAIGVAKRDWRDLLVAAGFANSLTEHKRWAEQILDAPASATN
jgi:hypothetical protein